MNDEYVVWLLVAGLAAVGALVWFLYGRLPRHEDDVSADELSAEATWISDALAEHGTSVEPEAVEQVLRLHRRYLAGVVVPREPGDPGWPLAEDAAPPAPAGLLGREGATEPDRGRGDVPEAGAREAG